MAHVAAEATRFEPQWSVHPGELLEEQLEARNETQSEFARRAGLTRKLVSTIIGAKNPVTPETAIAFERVLGLKANIWLSAQAAWDLDSARKRERTSEALTWLERFPIKELRSVGVLSGTKDAFHQVDELLKFFKVGSVAAYDQSIHRLQPNYRHSVKFESSVHCLRSWLQLGETIAESMSLATFSKEAWVEALTQIRSLTVETPEVFEPKVREYCAQAGVAFVLVKPLKGTHLSGAAYWLNSGAGVVQLSLRHKTNDHFWFSFFHEAAHLLLHGGNRHEVFADDTDGESNDKELEADAWAEQFLFGSTRLEAICNFVSSRIVAQIPYKAFVYEQAKALGIHPGILVGALQHKRVVEWSHLNEFKQRLAWATQ